MEGRIQEMREAAVEQRVGDAAAGEERFARVHAMTVGISYGGLQQRNADAVLAQKGDLER